MHLVMILVALVLSCWLRLHWSESTLSWTERASRAIFFFLFSPLLLLTTSVAVFCMGPHGRMSYGWEGWISYGLALSFLVFAYLLWLKLLLEARSIEKMIRSYPTLSVNGTKVRVINLPVVYSALIGLWEPEYIVSQGLLDTLDDAHLRAVLAHEQGHYYYRDTFWFFWLGWLRQLSAPLPHTKLLWNELLALRELRADCWATSQVDNLLLAETLLQVIKTPLGVEENFCAALSSLSTADCLEERIKALLMEPDAIHLLSMSLWMWLILAFLPLLVIPFHTFY